jgi:hypothetical protein
MAAMAGYSGTALAKKLGIKAGSRVLVSGAPDSYRTALEPLPESVAFASRLSEAVDVIHVFATQRAKLASALAGYRRAMRADASLWVSWPKKAARVETDITEGTIREVALPLGLVDVKVCAVDDIWSGLKLVVRKELR